MSLDKLLADAKEGSERLADAIESARPACVEAVRAVEKALVEALAGERLKGLPVLAGTEDNRFYAARIRGTITKRLYERPAMVVCSDGRFAVASAAGESGWETREVDDAELLAEDAESVPRAIVQVLGWHLERVARSAARYEELSRLAERLSQALAR